MQPYRPHVAFVCGGFRPDLDGVSDYIRRLLLALESRIDQVLVTSPDWRLPDIVRVLGRVRRERVHILHVQYAPVAFRWRRSVGLLPVLSRAILGSVPVVVTAHEVDANAGPLLSAADSVIATTLEHAERICNAPVSMIPIGPNIEPARGNPSALAHSARQRWCIPEDAPLIAFFGFLHPVKGLEYLLDAAADVRKQYPALHLVLAGGSRSLALPGGEGDAYAQQLMARAYDLGLGHAVHITGYLSEQDISALLFAADIVTLPFTFGLSFKSGSLLAAFAHRRPVVGTESALTDPRLVPGEHFVGVPPRAAGPLAAALLMLLRDASYRARLADAGARAAQSFAWPAIAEAHLQFYSELMSARR